MSSQGRVLLITSNFPRWASDSTTPFVLHLAQDLQALGWHIDVLAPHAAGTRSRESLDGIRVERFRYMWPASLETVCYQGGALINLRDRPSNVVKLPLLVASESFGVFRHLVGHKYDLLHSHWVLPQGFVGALLAPILGVPHLVTVHGGDIFALQGPILRAFKRFALYRADAVTVNSSATRDAVQKTAPRVREVHQIPMGVSTIPNVTPSTVVGLREQYRRSRGPLLMFVGRIVDEKGVEDLIRAVGLLVPRVPDVTAVILGEGQHRPIMEDLTQSLGLENRVTFLGWVPSYMVPNYLAAADVFVAPSRRAPDGWIEAQGLAAVEAMIARTPVIATRLGGIVDAVVHEQTGLLVSERSPPEIASAVEKLVRQPALGEHLRLGAYEMAVKKFGRATTAQAFSALFERLIGVRQRHRR